MYHRNDTVLRNGLGVVGATVTVYVNGTDAAGNYAGATKATLFSDKDGMIPLANPVVTDANGEFTYFIANGIYDEIVKYGSITDTNTYIQMFDQAGGEAVVATAAAVAARDVAVAAAASATASQNLATAAADNAATSADAADEGATTAQAARGDALAAAIDAQSSANSAADEASAALDAQAAAETAQAAAEAAAANNGVGFATRAALAAAPTTLKNAYLLEAGREGLFAWSGANLQTQVTADTGQGVYVPPTGQNGSTGAWVRVLSDAKVLRAKHFGVSAANSEATNTAIVDAILAQYLPGDLTLIFPSGIIPCRVKVPMLNQASMSTLTIKGETGPLSWFGTIDGDAFYAGGYAASTYGTMLTSSAVAGSSTTGGVIEVLTSGGWNNVRLNVQDLNIRTYDNPNQHGIIAYKAVQFTCERVNIDTGVWPTDMTTQPSHTAYGIRPPTNSNGALSYIRDVAITGYYVGLGLSEHTVTDSLYITACRYGIEIESDAGFAHPTRPQGSASINRCKTPILVSGTRTISDFTVAIEHANSALGNGSGGITTPGNTAVGNGWQVTDYDISDAAHQLTGTIHFTSALGGVGPNNVFTKNGGKNVRAVQLGPRMTNRATYKQTVAQAIANAAAYQATPATNVNIGAPDTTAPTAIETNRVFSVVGQQISVNEWGRYRVRAEVTFASNATGYRRVALCNLPAVVLQDISVPAVNGAPTTVCIEAICDISNTDGFAVKVEQNSGGALNVTQTIITMEQI